MNRLCGVINSSKLSEGRVCGPFACHPQTLPLIHRFAHRLRSVFLVLCRMAAIRGQVILKTVDAFPANYATNSWAFEVSAIPGQTSDITTILKAFYDTLRPYMSGRTAQNGHEIKWTALPGSPPNYPFATTTFNLTTAPAGGNMPQEVAMALSFQGARFAGLPQNRRRGRVFLGPLDSSVCGTDDRPVSAFLTTMTGAATTLKAACQALSPAVNWSVWSQTDADVVNITDGWMDNAFDTVRRRGIEVTSRTLF